MTTSKNDGHPYSDIQFNEELDPGVKVELDILNQSATDINRLEREIDEARGKYQTTFAESSQQLEQLKKRYGGSIRRARPYYELQEAASEAQSQALRSARKFQTSNGVYLAAKETISLAELRLMDDKAACLSAAWQEMLNHALLRVTEAEKEKSKNEEEHLKRAAVFADIENRLHILEKRQKRSIAKARQYFETKKELEIKLQQVKQTVEDLQQAFKAAKQRYSGALKHLEKISDSIHERRRQQFLLMFPREPGVGAEDNRSASESEPSLPTLSTSHDSDGIESLYDDSDDELYEEGYDDDGYSDINNESVFRAKVLTTSLDDDDTSFMTSKHGGKRKDKKSLKRTLSLPAYTKTRTSSDVSSQQSSCGSEACFTDEVFDKPLSPLQDRSEIYPPDGDSLSSEKNMTCDVSSSGSHDDIKSGTLQSQSSELLDASKTTSHEDMPQHAVTEVSRKKTENNESSTLKPTGRTSEGCTAGEA